MRFRTIYVFKGAFPPGIIFLSVFFLLMKSDRPSRGLRVQQPQWTVFQGAGALLFPSIYSNIEPEEKRQQRNKSTGTAEENGFFIPTL